MATTYLTRTPGSAGNRRTWTWSGWVKRGNLGTNTNTDQSIFDARESGNANPSFGMSFDGNEGGGASKDAIDILMFTSGIDYRLITSRVFRDTSAWYHIVFAVDTTQATSSDRLKLYVNGSQVTEFDTATYPSLNFEGAVNNNKQHGIGSLAYGGNYFDGVMAHVHFIDGTAYDASAFGETDSTTGQWKSKPSPSVTYGTNGFFLKFANSGSMGTDSSGNGNNFTVAAGTLTQTQDTPSNVFCTLNPLIGQGNQSSASYAHLNTQMSSSSTSSEVFTQGTFAVSSGKWYWEWRASGQDPEGNFWGVMNIDTYVGDGNIDTANNSNIWGQNQGDKFNGGNGGSYGSTVAINEIGMVALDMDNGKIWLGKEGSWFASGNPASGTNAMYTNLSGKTIAPFHSDNYSTKTPTGSYNFGNGYFGTTAVSSANSDDAGLGLFEYAPPTGFYSLCTKNINTYG